MFSNKPLNDILKLIRIVKGSWWIWFRGY